MDQHRYKECCGVVVCLACHFDADGFCPVCKEPDYSSYAELIKRLKARVEAHDAEAMTHLGRYYVEGTRGLQQDVQNGMKLLTRAAELGSIDACGSLGDVYNPKLGSKGVEKDTKKCLHYYEVAAVGGHEQARKILGVFEYSKGNTRRSFKHLMISASSGQDRSLEMVKEGFLAGKITKDEYEMTMRAYKESQDEIKSDHRDRALARTSTAAATNTASDEALFKQPPPNEDCAVCFLPNPHVGQVRYQSCCGKTLCLGCAVMVSKKGNNCCAFCRAPLNVSNSVHVNRLKARVEANDEDAMSLLGSCYVDGTHGFQQDLQKGMELWTGAAELGCTEACGILGDAYNPQRNIGPEGVESDIKKCIYYYELAAMGGHATARFNLGILEESAGNIDRAVKHLMIGAAAGHDTALQWIRDRYQDGHVSKEQFAKALRAHKESVDAMKSKEREEVVKLRY